MSDNKNNFPVITKVTLKNFTLYNKRKEILLDFNKNVFCLAGANGLGKSTFISIINYALTGVVRNPKKIFKSIVYTKNYYSANKKFHTSYFKGRINETDRKQSSVIIEFKIGDEEYILERGFFSSDKLIRFFKKNIDHCTHPLDDLSNIYKETILEKTGLATFDQFVFMQFYIFTFDEHHDLLVWNSSLMETTLHLIFGFNSENAQKANQLRNKINRLGSNRRNFVYHRNRVAEEIKNLENEIEKDKNPDKEKYVKEYYSIEQEVNELEDIVESNNREINELELQIGDKTLLLTNQESIYEELMENYLNPNDSDFFFKDDLTRSILGRLKNAICKDEKIHEISSTLINHIRENICYQTSKDIKEIGERLQIIDNSIYMLKEEIKELYKEKKRINSDFTSNKKDLEKSRKKMRDIEKQVGYSISYHNKDGDIGISKILLSYREQISILDDQIQDVINEKKEKEEELKKLEDVLKSNYASVENIFVPIFQGYIREFLGIDISTLFRRTKDSINLIIRINDKERLDSYQLSESQRYFIDIGFRMAVLEFSCKSCMLLVDTPEGSLDIAYESKAGTMFYGFSKIHKLVMTSNINSSHLLLELAKNCGHSSMNLERMTQWSHLSQVQIQEESKINDAYNHIKKALDQR